MPAITPGVASGLLKTIDLTAVTTVPAHAPVPLTLAVTV